MSDTGSRPRRQSLPTAIAAELRQFILQNRFEPGQRLPTTAELAARFNVGAPTMREALRKLETMGVVSMKHGSGIYVGEHPAGLMHATPGDLLEKPTKGLLLDLIEARMPIESLAVGSAARNITDEQLTHLDQLLARAKENLDNDEVLREVNMAFHRGIAEASGNSFLPEILGVLSELFAGEQRLIIDIYGSRQKDHSEHLALLDALKRHDADLAVKRMEAHLDGVRRAILQWVPDQDLSEGLQA